MGSSYNYTAKYRLPSPQRTSDVKLAATDLPALTTAVETALDTAIETAVADPSLVKTGDDRLMAEVDLRAAVTGMVLAGSDWKAQSLDIGDLTSDLLDRGTVDAATAGPLFVGPDWRGAPMTGGGATTAQASGPVLASGGFAHFGDSLTALGTPQALAALTGLDHKNLGWSGQTSVQVAARAGGVRILAQVEGGVIPATGSVNITSISPSPITANAWHGVGTLAGVPGYLKDTGTGVTFTRTEGSTAVPAPGKVEFLSENAAYLGRHLVIGVGRNDIPNIPPSAVVQNVRRIIDAQTCRVRSVVVWQIPPWPNEELGTAARTTYEAYNKALEAAFPEFWVPVADWLRTDAAATAAGVTWTQQDRDYIARGLTPPSLAVSATNLHFNAAGNKAWAARIHQHLTERNMLA